eukprot:11332290-Alexandrium_andersonii.AAC.1
MWATTPRSVNPHLTAARSLALAAGAAPRGGPPPAASDALPLGAAAAPEGEGDDPAAGGGSCGARGAGTALP